MASVSLYLLALAGGCDSDDGDGSGALLTNLSVADFNKHCEAIQDWEAKNVMFSDEETCKAVTYDQLLEFIATGRAQGAMVKDDASLQQACKEAQAECLNVIKTTPAPMMDPMKDMCTPPPSTCKATVAEFDACYKSVPDQIKRTIAGLPACEKLTIKDVDDLLDPNNTRFVIEDSAACKTFEMKCSDIPTPSMPAMMKK